MRTGAFRPVPGLALRERHPSTQDGRFFSIAGLATQARHAKLDGQEQLIILQPQAAINGFLLRKVAVVACDPGWSDVGPWNAISELAAPDESGNRVVGEALLHDVTNCYIQADGRLVGATGIESLLLPGHAADVWEFRGFMIGSVARNSLANANAVRDAF